MVVAGIDVYEKPKGVSQDTEHLIKFSEVFGGGFGRGVPFQSPHSVIISAYGRACEFRWLVKNDIRSLVHSMACAFLIFHLQQRVFRYETALIETVHKRAIECALKTAFGLEEPSIPDAAQRLTSRVDNQVLHATKPAGSTNQTSGGKTPSQGPEGLRHLGSEMKGFWNLARGKLRENLQKRRS